MPIPRQRERAKFVANKPPADILNESAAARTPTYVMIALRPTFYGTRYACVASGYFTAVSVNVSE